MLKDQGYIQYIYTYIQYYIEGQEFINLILRHSSISCHIYMHPMAPGPFLTYKLGGRGGGGGNAPQSPLVPPPPHEITFCPPPQEKSLFPKIIETNQRRLTNT